MYVSAFWFGVMVTILAYMILAIAASVIRSYREEDDEDDDDNQSKRR